MNISVPWYARIAAKLLLSALPVSYGTWKKIGIFAHGEMQDPGYALGVFNKHMISSGLSGRSGLVGLEMGPGDSVGSALAARAAGFSMFYLVDTGAYANSDPETYRAMSRNWRGRGMPAVDIDDANSLHDVLESCNATYLTNGLQSYREIPAASVDLIFSQAVLEHVRRDDFPQVAAEMRRILKPDGVASHQVDLQDHLGGGLNNMRIASRWWETEFMARSGFYTNRIRFGEMCREFEHAGFDVEVKSVVRWDTVPLPPRNLAAEFRHFSDDDLLVSSFHVLLRPKIPREAGQGN
jgi:SAM-dependent methyltransferase